jgi:hypothetical protein
VQPKGHESRAPLCGSDGCGHRGAYDVALASRGGVRGIQHGSPALVAQGIERRFPKPCVAGSNPAEGTSESGSDQDEQLVGTWSAFSVLTADNGEPPSRRCADEDTVAVSAGFEVVSERFSDDLGDRDPLIFGTASESLLHLRIEPDGFDG